MQHHQHGSLIASTIAKCLESFTRMGKIFDGGGDYQELKTAFIDCQGQFRIWSGNIGVYQTGNSSLDHRLRDVSHVSKGALQLLSALNSLITDARLLLTHRRQSFDNLLHDSDSSNNDSSDKEDAYGPSEVKQIFLDIAELIVSLHRLSMSIRNPTVTRRYSKDSSLDTSMFESYDVQHVRYRFPEAPEYLTCRLGKANSRRRGWLRYRELHAGKLAQDLDRDYTSTLLSETTASNFKSESIFERIHDNDLISVTSYVTSANTVIQTRMPSMPKAARNEQPFECPYCHGIERVQNSYAWKKHVYNDLRPFLCTFEECTFPTETYQSRRAWFNHELQNHRRLWTCNGHCKMTFKTEDLMVVHIQEHSRTALTDSQSLILARMCVNPIKETVTSKCPMCNLTITGLSKFSKHLGGHLEELALFALPVKIIESDAEDDPSSSSNEIDKNTEGLNLKRDDKGGHEESIEGIPSTVMTEANDALQRPENPPSISSEDLIFPDRTGQADYQVNEGDETTEEEWPKPSPSMSSEDLIFPDRTGQADYQVNEGDETTEEEWPKPSPSISSEDLIFPDRTGQADYQVNKEDETIEKDWLKSSPSISSEDLIFSDRSDQADYQVNERDETTEEEWPKPSTSTSEGRFGQLITYCHRFHIQTYGPVVCVAQVIL